MLDNVFQELLEVKMEEKFLKKAIDFYDLFSIISELFEELGLISESSDNPSQVSFKLSYPTDMVQSNQENTVIFELLERKLVNYSTSAGSIKQMKAHSIQKYADPVTGVQKDLSAYFFENKVLLYVYSASSEKLYQMLSALESIFLRYREWFSKNYRVKIEYNGIRSDASGHNTYHNSMGCKVICLTAYTEAQFEQQYELVKSIDTKHN